MPDGNGRTTETSQLEGRLKVGAGCNHGKKRCLKCALGKIKDGKGGGGIKMSNPRGYGKIPKSSIGIPPPPNVMKTKKVKSIRIKKYRAAKVKTSSKKFLIKSLLKKAKK